MTKAGSAERSLRMEGEKAGHFKSQIYAAWSRAWTYSWPSLV